MTSPAKRDANRRNASASTGPRTAGGKARANQNALRHGLARDVTRDPAWARRAAELAHLLASHGPPGLDPAAALAIAAAEVDGWRIRNRLTALLEAALQAQALLAEPDYEALLEDVRAFLEQSAAIARGRAMVAGVGPAPQPRRGTRIPPHRALP